MTWTSPKIFDEGEILTARDLNIYLRDNSLTTEAAIATGAGNYLTTDADNNLVEREVHYKELEEIQTIRWAGFSENTTNLELVVETGTSALVGLSSGFSIGDIMLPVGPSFPNQWYRGGAFIQVSLDVPGGYTPVYSGPLLLQADITAPDQTGGTATAIGNVPFQVSRMGLVTGLKPGKNIFRYKYSCTAPGRCFVSSQRLFVMPF